MQQSHGSESQVCFVSFFPFTKVNQQVMTVHVHEKYIPLQEQTIFATKEGNVSEYFGSSAPVSSGFVLC